MAKVVVRFFDDETLEGVARDLDFDEPDFLVEVDDAGGLENNETAWIPLTAVKWVELPRDKDLASETPTRKVAIRFLDGEVLRGHLDGSLERHRYGVVLNLHAEQSDSPVRKLGIPFSAVKALFFIRGCLPGPPDHGSAVGRARRDGHADPLAPGRPAVRPRIRLQTHTGPRETVETQEVFRKPPPA
jgi:hypothetical protein